MKLHVESFGRVGAGSAFLYTLTNASGAYVSITDYSGAVVALGYAGQRLFVAVVAVDALFEDGVDRDGVERQC